MNAFKLVLADTNIISELGKINNFKDFAYDFLVNKKLILCVTLNTIIELKKQPKLFSNVIGLLNDMMSVATLLNKEEIIIEESKRFPQYEVINPVKIVHTPFAVDKFDASLNLSNYIGKLTKLQDFIQAEKEHELAINQISQERKDKDLKEMDYVFYRTLTDVGNNCTDFLEAHKDNPQVVYDHFCGLKTMYHMMWRKLDTADFRKKPQEIHDSLDSFYAPYVDIIVTERKQVNLYNQIIEQKLVMQLNNKEFYMFSDLFNENTYTTNWRKL